MKQNTDYQSGITGRAQVRYGGKIHIGIGYSKERNLGFIELRELKDNYEVGADIPKGADEYNTQVSLVFNNLTSIDMMRDALDNLESAFKDGAFLKAQKYKRASKKE